MKNTTQSPDEDVPTEYGVIHTTDNGREYVLGAIDDPSIIRETITNRASVEELIEFSNKVRKAGGADPIDDLFVSVPKESSACLIANSLNFESCVNDDSGGRGWVMWTTEEIAEKIEREVGLEICYDADLDLGYDGACVILPRNIALVAEAFDTGRDIELHKWDLNRQEEETTWVI